MYPLPFRWNLARQEQLGKLIEPLKDKKLSFPFINDVVQCCAKIVGYSGNSRLVFVGRSPEYFFDYLSGLLSGTSWEERISLLHFSMRFQEESKIRKEYPEAIPAMREYLTSLNLHPHGIATGDHPVTFVDAVDTGDTFSRLIHLLHNWCKEIGYDWLAVNRRIKLVGITERTHNSPNTWRWQQQVDWIDLLRQNSVKNISVDLYFSRILTVWGRKMTKSYHPARWGDEELAHPDHQEKRIEALCWAYTLFQQAKTRESRLEFIKQLTELPAIKESWLRKLTQELRFKAS